MTHKERLNEVLHDLKQGKERRETVRTLLSWFGYMKRSRGQAEAVEVALRDAGLKTDPDFRLPWIDVEVAFVLLAKSEKNASTRVSPLEEGECGEDDAGTHDPTYRIGRLKAANLQPTTVNPSGTVSEAVTLMLINDFSQLPVVSGRTLKGVVSWKSIGSRLALKRKCEKVQDVMEPRIPVGKEVSIFQAIQQIVEHDYVLVENPDHTLSGIVTTSDLSLQFRDLAEPFLVLGEIENHLRHIIDSKFNGTILAACKDERDANRTICGAADLTFGEYLRLLEQDQNWDRLSTTLDRKTFVSKLDDVRRIRNDVMHFDPEGIEDSALEALRDFGRFLRTLRATGVF